MSLDDHLAVFYHAEVAIPLYPDRPATTEEPSLSFVYSDVLVGRCLLCLCAEWRPDACVVLVPLPVTITIPLLEFKPPHKRQFPAETCILLWLNNSRISFFSTAGKARSPRCSKACQ